MSAPSCGTRLAASHPWVWESALTQLLVLLVLPGELGAEGPGSLQAVSAQFRWPPGS